MAASAEIAEDLTSRSWKNQQWLDMYPLADHRSVITYFTESIFYDPNCNNEVARKQFMDPTRIENLPPGIEYVVTEAQPPHLFVICKRKRSLVEATSQAFYYILDGVVYQAPTLHQVLSSRMNRCKWNIRQALTKMKQHLDPLMQIKSQEGDADASAAAEEPPAEVVKQRPLSQAEAEHAMKIDNIIANVLRKHATQDTRNAVPTIKVESGAVDKKQPAAGSAQGSKREADQGNDHGGSPAVKKPRT